MGGRRSAAAYLLGNLGFGALKARIRSSAERSADDVGQTERRRGAMGSKLLIAGTRIPVSAVQRFLQRGTPVAEILEAHPSLKERDVEAIRDHLISA